MFTKLTHSQKQTASAAVSGPIFISFMVFSGNLHTFLANLCNASLLKRCQTTGKAFFWLFTNTLALLQYCRQPSFRIRSHTKMHHLIWSCKWYKRQFVCCVELVLTCHLYIKQEGLKTHFSAKHSVRRERKIKAWIWNGRETKVNGSLFCFWVQRALPHKSLLHVTVGLLRKALITWIKVGDETFQKFTLLQLMCESRGFKGYLTGSNSM